MAKVDEAVYSEEQQRTLKHFNTRSDYWYEIYHDEASYAGYTLLKQHQFIVQLIERSADAQHILDVGCGAGVTVMELAEKGYQASGLDIAPNMIQKAQEEAHRRQLNCDFRVGVAETLPYPEQAFDVVIGLGLLGNILEDQAALNEMARVLKPGGRLILTVPNLLALDLLIALPKSLPIMLGATRLRQPLRIAGNLARRLTGRQPKDLTHLRFNQCVVPRNFVKHLEASGFHEVHYTPLTFGPIMPFGLRLLSDQTSIRISERMVRWAEKSGFLRTLGTLVVYEGRR